MSEKNSVDEVSLIDIIAVLIRYRRFILIATLVAVIISLCVAFIVPESRYRQNLAEEFYEGSAAFSPSNGLKMFIDEEDAVRYVMLAFKDSSVLERALERSGIDTGWTAAGHYSVAENEGIINVSVRMLEEEGSAELLLNALSIESAVSLRTVLNDTAAAEITGFERLVEIEYPRAVIEENLVKTFRSYSAALSFVSGEEPGIINVQAVNERRSTLNKAVLRNSFIKRALVVIVLVFFAAVLFSFVLNWIEYIRNDEASMKKIRSAVRRERV